MDSYISSALFRNKFLFERICYKIITSLIIAFIPISVYSQEINFSSSGLAGVSLNNPTSLEFGPDGRLYVSQQNGTIFAYTISRNGPSDYQVTHTEIISLVKNIPNHNDDGSLNTLVNTRQVTSVLLTGTAGNPVLYVGSSDPRIGGGGTGGDKNLDTNSGIISRLTWTGMAWDKVDIIRGLPRSEENHANNGMQLDEINNVLYIAQGGNTNAGAPSNNFAFQTEYALAAAILSVDLDAIGAMPIKGTGNNKYIYDIPTVDDPGRLNMSNPDYDLGIPGSPQSIDVNDPFGGNDGLNQAKVIPGGPVQVYSPGYRNAYDIVITKTPGKENRMYTVDNGPNGGWGGHPENEGAFGNPLATNVTNNYVVGEPGSTGSGPNDEKVNNKDNLHLISAPGIEPIYGGHPNPIRANPSGAGLYWFNNNTGQAQFSLKPTSDWPPVPASMANPIEGDYRNPGVGDGALHTFIASTNGMAEYTAPNFDGAMQGDLLAASFGGEIFRIQLNTDGTQVANVEVLASNFGSTPLDVIAQGPGEIFEGSIWAATYGADEITIFEPESSSSWLLENALDNSLPKARHENAYVEAGEKFYLMGGRNSRPLDIYDPKTSTWTTGTAPPLQFHHFQAVELNGLIYVVGAFTGNFPSETPVSNIYIYNPTTNTWATGANIPIGRRRGSGGIVVHNNKIYWVCGIKNGHTDGWVPWLDVYDPSTNTWTALADAPRSRDHFHASLIDNKIYLAGGRKSGFGGSTFAATVPEVDVYDINNGIWSTLPASSNIPTPRAGASAVVLNNELLVIGGESASQSLAHNETEVFNPITKNWQTLAPLGIGRHGTQAISYNGKIYIAAGSGQQGGSPELNSQEVYTNSDVACTGNNTSYTLDDDKDGYSNADEIDNGTNPCSAASIPPDNEGDFISDLNDPDDDNDGVLDTADKFALDANNGINTQISIDYPFLNGNPGYGLFGLGFTGLMTNGTDDYQNLYNADHPDLIMGGAVGLASIPANSGDALNNDQEYAFQFGVNVTSSTPPFTVHSKILGSPFFNGQSPSKQSQGIYIGTGDQDNYLKAVLTANNGNPGIQILHESNGIVIFNNTYPITNILQAGEVDIYLDVDPSNGTVQVKYSTSTNSSLKATAGPAIKVSGPVLNVIQGTPAMAVGLIATSGSSSSFVATWDFIRINLTHQIASTRINSGGAAFTYNTEGWQTDQYASAGSTYSGSLAIAGTENDKLYQSERYGINFSYNIPVSASGTYSVKLLFAEIFHGVKNTKGAGTRVFNVNIENGQGQLTNYDIFVAAGGKATAVIETFDNIEVTDGNISIAFSAVKDNAKISGIEILPSGESINLPPIVTNPGNLTYSEGAAVNLQIQASDPEGDVLTYVQTGLPAPLSIAAATGLISGTIEANTGEYPVTVTVKDDGGLSSQATFTIKIVNGSIASAKRVNSGGAALTFNGEGWGAEQYATGGKIHTSDVSIPIEGTLNDGIYQSERYGNFTYNIPLPNGVYDLNLHFAEIYFGVKATGGTGKRVFNVNVEGGQAQLQKYDIIAKAGGHAKAIVERFSGVNVSDGSMTIAFSSVINNAKISAFEVLSQGVITNNPPTLTSPGNQSFTEGAAVSLQIQASDPDGDVLKYAQTGLPASLSISTATGLISGILEANAGEYSVIVAVTDNGGLSAQTTFDMTIADEITNAAPVLAAIGDKYIHEGKTLNLNISALDPDGDIPKLTVAGLPSFGTFTDFENGKGVLSLLPATGDAGDYPITITATDSDGLTNGETFTVFVTKDNLATLFYINSGGAAFAFNGTEWLKDQYASLGSSYSSSMAIAKTENDKLYHSERYGKDFSYNIPVNASGTYTIKLHFAEIFHGVKNTKGLGTRVFNVNIENGQGQLTNYDIIAAAGGSAIAIVETFENIMVTDGKVSIGFSTLKDNAKISGIEILSSGASANLPPIITNPGNQSFVEGAAVSLQIQASDPDEGDVLKYTQTGLPASLFINATTGLISGSIAASAGEYPVTVAVTDDAGLSNQASFKLTVTGVPANNPPTVINPGNQSFVEGAAVSLQIQASDPDEGDVLKYTQTGLPASLFINATTGLISGSIAASAGEYPVTVTVTDANGLFSQASFITNIIQGATASAKRINSGGVKLTYNEEDWGSDQYASGGIVYTTNVSIAGTLNDAIYQSERYGNFSYNIPLPNGSYDLNLHFAELYFGVKTTGGTGKRVFNVNVEGGQAQLQGYDIIAEAGGHAKAIVERFNGVNVSDGNLTIAFSSLINYAKISAIEIISIDSKITSTSISNHFGKDIRISNIESVEAPLENNGIKIYPNPAVNHFTIEFSLPQKEHVAFLLFDELGRQFALGDFVLEAGKSRLNWDVAHLNLHDGIYYLRVKSKQMNPHVYKLVIIK